MRSPTSRFRGYIRFTKEFPLTVTGKIQKFRLRDRAVEELGLEGQGETA